MKENLPKEDLGFLEFHRSNPYIPFACGNNEDEQDRTPIEITLETNPSAKKPNFLKKIFPFL